MPVLAVVPLVKFETAEGVRSFRFKMRTSAKSSLCLNAYLIIAGAGIINSLVGPDTFCSNLL